MAAYGGFDDSLPDGLKDVLSPIMSAGLDPNEVLASGDAPGMLAAKRAGVPYQSARNLAQQATQQAFPVPSQLAAAAASTPRSQFVSAAPNKAEIRDQVANVTLPQQTPWSNPSAPTSEPVGTPSVPAVVRPSGTAPQNSMPARASATPWSTPPNVTPGNDDSGGHATFQNLADQQRNAALRAEQLNQGLMDEPTAEARLSPLEQRRASLASPASATNPEGVPNPRDPQYRPTFKQRFGRGVLATVEGLARGGVSGAVLGAVDPQAVGATAYGAPNKRYSQDAQQNQQRTNVLESQIEQGQKDYGLGTARVKDEIASIKDIGSMAGDAAKTLASNDRTQYQQQLADVKQQVADYQQQLAENKQPKLPTSYEGTVVAAALETDPQRKAALNQAARTMAATELKKFQYKADQDGSPRSAFRQSMIDNATQEIQNLQDSYRYDWRRNSYIDDKGDELTPQQFTDKKNAIATKLDQQLTGKKLKPLGVRFNASDAGAGRANGRNGSTSASARPMPPASLLAKTPEGGIVRGQNGETYAKRGGRWVAQ